MLFTVGILQENDSIVVYISWIVIKLIPQFLRRLIQHHFWIPKIVFCISIDILSISIINRNKQIEGFGCHHIWFHHLLLLFSIFNNHFLNLFIYISYIWVFVFDEFPIAFLLWHHEMINFLHLFKILAANYEIFVIFWDAVLHFINGNMFVRIYCGRARTLTTDTAIEHSWRHWVNSWHPSNPGLTFIKYSGGEDLRSLTCNLSFHLYLFFSLLNMLDDISIALKWYNLNPFIISFFGTNFWNFLDAINHISLWIFLHI